MPCWWNVSATSPTRPAQNQGPVHEPLSNGRLSPMKLLAIEPESSNVTTMFGSTEASRSGGVGLRSTSPGWPVAANTCDIENASAATINAVRADRMARLNEVRMIVPSRAGSVAGIEVGDGVRAKHAFGGAHQRGRSALASRRDAIEMHA